nr:hypothetical protein GCM10020063_070750 [Dactylosporangium thailandense]
MKVIATTIAEHRAAPCSDAFAAHVVRMTAARRRSGMVSALPEQVIAADTLHDLAMRVRLDADPRSPAPGGRPGRGTVGQVWDGSGDRIRRMAKLW